jgi:hypothetical protein
MERVDTNPAASASADCKQVSAMPLPPPKKSSHPPQPDGRLFQVERGAIREIEWARFDPGKVNNLLEHLRASATAESKSRKIGSHRRRSAAVSEAGKLL